MAKYTLTINIESAGLVEKETKISTDDSNMIHTELRNFMEKFSPGENDFTQITILKQ